MRIRSRFVDADGERNLDKVIQKNHEAVEIIEENWVKSFRDMLMDALKCGDDVEILVKRMPGDNNFVV